MIKSKFTHVVSLLFLIQEYGYAEQPPLNRIRFEDAYAVQNEKIYDAIIDSKWTVYEEDGVKEISILDYDTHEGRTVRIACDLRPRDGQPKSCELITGAPVSGKQPRNGFRNFDWRTYSQKDVEKMSAMKWVHEDKEGDKVSTLSFNGTIFISDDSTAHFSITCSRQQLACYYKTQVLLDK